MWFLGIRFDYCGVGGGLGFSGVVCVLFLADYARATRVIWNILSLSPLEIKLPHTLNKRTVYGVIQEVVNDKYDAICSRVIFNFENLQFIEPTGVVSFSSLIEYLRKLGVKVSFKEFDSKTPANKYLDDSMFFQHYVRKTVSPVAAQRSTTVPLHLVEESKVFSFLENNLMPWLADRVGMSTKSLSGVSVCFQEIFHNINDHSEVKIGCAFAQFFPNKSQIQVSISDFGVGIPTVVRKVIPSIADADALKKACEEGFTTKSNVRNRGAGLPTLIKYVTQRNRGHVLLASGQAQIVGSPKDVGHTKMTPRKVGGYYPGTLVEVILKTNTFEAVAEDMELEEFEW